MSKGKKMEVQQTEVRTFVFARLCNKSTREGSQKRAKALANGKSWPYQIFFDKNQDFKRALGTSYIPQTFIIKNKEIVYQHTGYQPGDEEYLFNKLMENETN